MKTFKIIAILICTIALTSTLVFADSDTTTAGGQTLSLDASAVGVPFNFTPSPSTLMSLFTDGTAGTAFAMTAGSDKTTVENGLEYGVLSTRSPIYQKTKTSMTVPVTPQTSATALAGTGWADKAGNTPEDAEEETTVEE